MSYASSQADTYRQVAIYTARVLKGDKLADLPVQQSIKVEWTTSKLPRRSGLRSRCRCSAAPTRCSNDAATRVHHAPRRRGGRVAARGARSAAKMPVIGFINPASPVELANRVSAFRNGLAELGFVEGRNVMIEYRWAEGRYDQLPALANDLVGRGVAAIAATGGIASARAARLATGDVPIVFTTGTDPVEAGLVMSLNRPGGNVTGAGLMSATPRIKATSRSSVN